VKRASVDELDAWFEAGFIDARTMVLAGDATRWTRLGQLAGLDEEAPPVRRGPPAYVPPPLASHRPVSIDLTETPLDEDNPFAPRRRAGRGTTGWAVALGGAVLMASVGGFVAYRQPSWAQPYVSRALHATGFQASAASPAVPVFPTAVEAPSSPASPPAQATPLWQSAPPGAPGGLGSVPQPVDHPGVDPSRHTAGSDRMHGPKGKTNRSTGAAVKAHAPARKSAQPFTTTGNKFDPLNSSI
jgi:hypothetical protein